MFFFPAIQAGKSFLAQHTFHHKGSPFRRGPPRCNKKRLSKSYDRPSEASMSWNIQSVHSMADALKQVCDYGCDRLRNAKETQDRYGL
jgi:hypothetical protein